MTLDDAPEIEKAYGDEIDRLLLQVQLREITLCETCDVFFKYVPQKRFCDICKAKRRLEYQREYFKRPEAKKYRQEYEKRPEVKEYRRKYNQRPEVKESKRKRMREYYRRKKGEEE